VALKKLWPEILPFPVFLNRFGGGAIGSDFGHYEYPPFD